MSRSAMMILPIANMACWARPAAARSGLFKCRINADGTTCQERPNRSFSHPHLDSSPPRGQRRPVVVDFGLGLDGDEERHRLGEPELRAAVERDEALALQLERGGEVVDDLDLRVGEHGRVERDGFSDVAVEPEEGRDRGHEAPWRGSIAFATRAVAGDAIEPASAAGVSLRRCTPFPETATPW